jgi:(p)ppGpp synthase/HD superfamily hydrolase
MDAGRSKARNMAASLQGETEKIVVGLHDVVEDTPITLEELRAQGYSAEVIEALNCVTRRGDETYEAFILRAGNNPLARAVKVADLKDNMNLSRISNPTQKDHQRIERYQRALQVLIAEIV